MGIEDFKRKNAHLIAELGNPRKQKREAYEKDPDYWKNNSESNDENSNENQDDLNNKNNDPNSSAFDSLLDKK